MLLLDRIVGGASLGLARKRTRLFARSRADLAALVGAAQKAAARGTLGVALAPLENAAGALRAQLP